MTKTKLVIISPDPIFWDFFWVFLPVLDRSSGIYK